MNEVKLFHISEIVQASEKMEIFANKTMAYKTITKIKNNTGIPIIAGGLVEKKEEIYAAINAGASGVSTGAVDLWEM